VGVTVTAQDNWQEFGGSGAALAFAHANGYPPGVYRAFLEALTSSCRVSAFRQRPLWSRHPAPLRANWHLLADDLCRALRARREGPVWMVGHSLGGVVSLLAVLRDPGLFRGLILLDPVFLPTRQALPLNLVPRSRLHKLPLVRKTLGRPERFASREEAFAFHRGKRAFARFADEALWDYVQEGTRPGGEGVELLYSPAWEAAVYASVPLIWPRLLRLRLPTLGLRGEHSDILSEAALRRWQRLQPGAELHTCAGGHLLPLEEPRATAEYVLDFLARRAD